MKIKELFDMQLHQLLCCFPRVTQILSSLRLLSVLRGHSFFHPCHFEGLTNPDLIHYIYFTILILEKEPVFPF